MNKTKSVVVDSDSIFAIYNPNDPLNPQAIKTLKWLIKEEYQLIYPTSVIFEVVSLFQRVLPIQTVTEKLINMTRNNELLIYIVDQELLKETALIFKPKGSRKNTLIDCSVAAVAKKIKAKGIFSFDEFYTKQGLVLVKDLVGK